MVRYHPIVTPPKGGVPSLYSGGLLGRLCLFKKSAKNRQMQKNSKIGKSFCKSAPNRRKIGKKGQKKGKNAKKIAKIYCKIEKREYNRK